MLPFQMVMEIEALGGETVMRLRENSLAELTPEGKEELLNKIFFVRNRIKEYITPADAEFKREI